jgi:hypothetical protein
MSTVRTKFHMDLGTHMYADAPRDLIVEQIIGLYCDKGIAGLTNTRWPLTPFQTPTHHIIHDLGYQLGRWCLDHGAHSLLKSFHSVFTAQAHKELIAYTLHENDNKGLQFLIGLRADGWSDALSVAFGVKSNQTWLQKVLNYPTTNFQWQQGVHNLLVECNRTNNIKAVEALLGGWCGVCQSLLCTSSAHAVRPFLSAQTPSKDLANVVASFTNSFLCPNMHTLENCAEVLDRVRQHPSWDNELKEVQQPLDKILRMALNLENEDLVGLLLGCNDRPLSATEKQQRLCVNPKLITSAFLSINSNRASLKPYFMGLMDDAFFEGKREWRDVLDANRQQRQYVALQTATEDCGAARLKRKM